MLKVSLKEEDRGTEEADYQDEQVPKVPLERPSSSIEEEKPQDEGSVDGHPRYQTSSQEDEAPQDVYPSLLLCDVPPIRGLGYKPHLQ